jgi:hypothetical protein
MTEISSFLEPPADPVIAPNGHVDEGEQTLPRVDPARGVFITSRGDEIELSSKPISSLMLERLTNDGKPKIPMVEVTLMGKHRQLEPHPDDPGYKALLEEWTLESRMKTMRYVFIMGVKGQPPQDFMDEQRPFFPNATDSDFKYLWVASRLPDDDIDTFIEAVIGRTTPTQKGLAQSADSFQHQD